MQREPVAEYHCFESPIGPCTVRWEKESVTGFLLPYGPLEAQQQEAARRWPDDDLSPPPEWIQTVQSAVISLLHGDRTDLTWISVDVGAVPAFHRTVYELTRAIPPGKTLSYGELAALSGAPRGAQAVGYALGRNPIPVIIPCHRVLAANGELHGFSAPGGLMTKRKLLEIEGVVLQPQTELFGSA